MTKNKTSFGKRINVEDSKYYTNRELSWIQFNERVLSEAEDESVAVGLTPEEYRLITGAGKGRIRVNAD